MSYNGSGTFQINTSGQPVVAGTVISSTAFNALTADLATGLSTAITKDGQTTTTARIPFAAGINSSSATDSTSTSTGSIITSGGVGIAKALYVGTTLNVTGVATFSATPIYSSLTASSAVATDASKNLVSVTNTGTGNNVLATSPTLVTPILGTPQSGSLVNCTDTNYTGFKNRIINGAMVIDQRNAGAEVNPAVANAYYVDRWFVSSSAASKFKIQQTPSATETGFATRVSAGFTNYLGLTSLSAYTVGAAESFSVRQRIEGLNVADLAWGTASAATVTLSFWAYSSLTGTFGGALKNSANDRSYPFSYSIPVASTWTQISITIAGDTSGTWLTTNGTGIQLIFSIGTGSTLSGTAGAWAASNLSSATGAVSVVGTNAATWYVTGVQLEKGSTATSFDYRPYGTELALCQRYFYKSQNTTGSNIYPIVLQAYSTTAAFGKICDLPVTMRANPTSATTATSGTFTPSTALGGAAGAFTGTNIDVPTLNNLSTQGWTGSSGLVAGNATTVGLPNNAFFSASAEL